LVAIIRVPVGQGRAGGARDQANRDAAFRKQLAGEEIRAIDAADRGLVVENLPDLYLRILGMLALQRVLCERLGDPMDGRLPGTPMSLFFKVQKIQHIEIWQRRKLFFYCVDSKHVRLTAEDPYVANQNMMKTKLVLCGRGGCRDGNRIWSTGRQLFDHHTSRA